MTATEVRHGRGARLGTAAAFPLFLTLGAATAGLGAALPAVTERFARAADSGGLLVSLYNAGALVAIVACGVGKRSVAPRGELAVMIGLFAAGCAGAGLAPSWPVLLISATVAGCGYGGAVLHVNTAFARGSGHRAVLLLNLVNATFGLGAVAGPFVVGLLPDARTVFLGVGVLALLSLPACRCAVRESGVREGKPAFATLTPFLVLAFCYAGLETGIGAWAATHLTWTGLSPAAAAQWVSLYWLGITAGRFVVPLFARGPRRIVGWCLLAATAATAVAMWAVAAPYAYVAAGFALAAVFPTVIAWLATLLSAVRQANAMLLVAEMAGSVTHPLLIGWIATGTRPAAVPLTIAVLGVLALAASRWAGRQASA
ncbi:MFS transporter [Amycolatopsis alba]|uniref:MFS transporter n=1 Tax=Amycolatopsis alba DSM 44262 TaxID=1125972 RepID=A0A229RQD6_AMYAL|nr:MFS transporter [Amycolatopsis alba]OXM48863.1 MFS transporter [Amycolatopsis alba DSM 44262]